MASNLSTSRCWYSWVGPPHRTVHMPNVHGYQSFVMQRHTVLVGDRNDAFQSLLAFNANHRPRENSMASFNILMQSERNWPAAAHPKNKTEIRCSSTLLLFHLPCSNDELLSYLSAHESKPNAIYWNLLQHAARWFQMLFILFIVQIRSVFAFQKFWDSLIASGQHPPDNRRPFCLGLGGLGSVKSTQHMFHQNSQLRPASVAFLPPGT